MTRTITTEQLENMTWVVESIEAGDHEIERIENRFDEMDDDGELVGLPGYISYQYGTCILRTVENPDIRYVFSWLVQGGEDTLEHAYEFDLSLNPNDEPKLYADGYRIIDIFGDEISVEQAADEVGHLITVIADWQRAVRPFLPTQPGPDSIDNDENDGMDTITLENDHGSDIRFSGEQIASASSYNPVDGPNNQRWTELDLYRTAGGKLVCSEVGATRWAGERTRYKTHVADSEQELIEMLGYGWLAKDLYANAGIDHATDIE